MASPTSDLVHKPVTVLVMGVCFVFSYFSCLLDLTSCLEQIQSEKLRWQFGKKLPGECEHASVVWFNAILLNKRGDCYLGQGRGRCQVDIILSWELSHDGT